MNPYRTVTKNWLVVLLNTLLVRLWALFIVAFIARGMGVENYGAFTFAFTMTSMFAFIGNLGLYSWLVRELARRSDKISELVGDAFVCRFVLATIMLAVLFVYIGLSQFDSSKTTLLIIASFAVWTEVMAGHFASFFEGSQRMELSSIPGSVGSALQGIFAIAAIVSGYDYVGVAIAYLAANVAGLLLFYVLFKRYYPSLSLVASRGAFRRGQAMIRESLPFGMIGIFVMLQFKLDMVLLSYLRGDAELAYYSIAAKVAYSFLVISTALSTALYPTLAALLRKDVGEASNVFRVALYLLLMIGLPIAIGGTITSQKVVELFGGHQYAPSAGMLKIIIWYVPLCFLGSLFANSMNAAGLERIVAKTAFVQTGLNLTLNLYLIPRFGGVGAAWATVLTEIVGVGCYAVCLRSVLTFNLRRLPMIVICNALLFGFVWSLIDYNLLWIVPTSAITYVVLLWVFKVATRRDVLMVKTYLLKRPA